MSLFKTKSLLIILIFSLTEFAFALQVGCRIVPKQAVYIVDKMIHSSFMETTNEEDRSRYLRNTIPINTRVEYSTVKNSNQIHDTVQYESILRPLKTDEFDLFKLILFKLERTRHLMYVCLNFNSLIPSETHLTIYFMQAYGLEPQTLGRDNLTTIPGDWLFGPDGILKSKNDKVAQIARIPIQFLPLEKLSNSFSFFARILPNLDKIFQIPSGILKIPVGILSKINEKLGAGVERIEVTSTGIEFANSVDLANPQKANILYRFDFNKQ